MLDFFLNCFVTTTAVCVLSIWCKELIQLGTALWLAPRFGFKVKHFNLFHIHFENENGKWVTTKGKFSYLIQPLITIDLDQYTTPEENERKEKQLEALRIAILIAISVLLTILCLGPIRRVTAGEYGVMDCFLTAFCTGMCLHSLTTLGIRLYVYGVMMKKMLGYIQTLGNRLRAGESFTTMQIPPIEQLPYENSTQMEKMFYYNY